MQSVNFNRGFERRKRGRRDTNPQLSDRWCLLAAPVFQPPQPIAQVTRTLGSLLLEQSLFAGNRTRDSNKKQII